MFLLLNLEIILRNKICYFFWCFYAFHDDVMPVDSNLLIYYCVLITSAVQLQYFKFFLFLSQEITNQENQNNTDVCSDTEMLDALDLKDIHYGMWVKVKYEGEIILGNILSVVNNQTQF